MQKQPKRRIKASRSVRDQAVIDKSITRGPTRVRRTASAVFSPIKAMHRTGKKEYYLPMPDSRLGRFLNKKRHIIPSYFRNSFKELRDVKWTSRKETVNLTMAVFIFAVVFGIIIALTDYGLDKLFKKILLL